LEAKQNKIHLTATDLEMQISLTVDTATTGDFTTTLSAKKLLDISRSLPESAEINMATNDSRITVKAGKSRFNLQTLPAADYPVMTKTSSEATLIVISQSQLKDLFKQVEFAMAQQDIRYYLNGLLFEVIANRLNIVGTDGHRLSFTSTTLEKNYEKQEVILPRKTVIELIKLLDDSDDLVNIEISSNQVNFSFANIKLISKVIDGKFPDYNRVIPVGHKNTFTTDRVNILLAMQRASILSNEKYRGIRMVLNQNNLKLISTNSDQEEAEEELEINYAGDALDIGFNVTYLIDVLNNTNSDQITFSFADANSSCLITIPSNIDYKYVVMPMRI
jgi:DNA polymerase-3 subunit beta